MISFSNFVVVLWTSFDDMVREVWAFPHFLKFCEPEGLNCAPNIMFRLHVCLDVKIYRLSNPSYTTKSGRKGISLMQPNHDDT